MKSILPSLITTIALLVGCSGASGNNAMAPPVLPGNISESQSTANHLSLGLWLVTVSGDHSSAEIVPLRGTNFHANITEFLESNPLAKTLKIKSILPGPDSTINVDFEVYHPFPGNYNLTGFDTRAVFITGSNFTFPVSGQSISWQPDGPVLIYPDGYTHLFNPSEYPQASGSSVFTYYDGKSAHGDNLTATLNPFVAMSKNTPRRTFASGDIESVNFRIQAMDGAFSFGYAVMSCWVPPAMEVTDPVTQFPDEANSREALEINYEYWPFLEPGVAGDTTLSVEIFDNQGNNSIQKVTVECPALFDGEVELNFSFQIENGGYVYTGTLVNSKSPDAGIYPCLVKVEDITSDPVFGKNTTSQIIQIRVQDEWARTWSRGKNPSGLRVNQNGEPLMSIYTDESTDLALAPGDGSLISGRSLNKFDSRGELLWSTKLNNDFSWTEFDQVPDGQFFVTGNFEKVVNVDLFGGTYELTPYAWSDSSRDAAVISYNQSGGVSWAANWGVAEGYEDGWCGNTDVSTDGNVALYVAGLYGSDVDFDPGPGENIFSTSTNFQNLFVSKFSILGNYQWTVSIGDDTNRISDLKTLATSNGIYILGEFQDTVDFDPGPGEYILTAEGSWDDFLLKLDQNGNFIWAYGLGSTIGSENDFRIEDFCEDSSGNFITTGTVRGIFDLDPGPGIDLVDTESGDEIYISRFGPSGLYLGSIVWENASGVGFPLACRVLPDNSILIAGGFSGIFDMDPGPNTYLASNKGERDAMVIKLDQNLDFVWGRSFGWHKYDYIAYIDFDLSGNVYLQCKIPGYPDFDPGPHIEENILSHGCLIKLNSDGNWQ